jgi:hypothetical protein
MKRKRPVSLADNQKSHRPAKPRHSAWALAPSFYRRPHRKWATDHLPFLLASADFLAKSRTRRKASWTRGAAAHGARLPP